MDASLGIGEQVEGEIELLKSAFSNEFEDLRGTSEETNEALFRLKLGPNHSLGGSLYSHISVTVRISTPMEYPHKAADVTLESCEGISSQASETLENELKDLCSKYSQSGSVVMLEICQHVQNFLTDHAKPYAESIYEEMMADKKAKEAAFLEAEEESLKEKEKEEEERKIHLLGEVNRVQEQLKEEARLRRMRHRSIHGKERNSSIDACRSPMRLSSEYNENSETNSAATAFTYLTSGKKEHQIILEETLGDRPEQFCFIEVGFNKTTLERCALYSWFIRGNQKKSRKSQIMLEIDELMLKLNNIEREMNSLVRLSHKNLVHYRGMKFQRPEDDCIHLYVIQEFIQGLSVKFYLDNNIPINESFLYHIASGLVTAVNYLHVNDIVHRNIRDSCIFLDQYTHNVRLSDFGIERRCVEAVLEFNGNELPAVYPSAPGKGGKKADIFRIGIILLSLITGKHVKEVVSVLPSDLSDNLKSFLNHCLEIGELERWTAAQLLAHPFLVDDIKERKGSSEEKNNLMERENNDAEAANNVEAEHGMTSGSLQFPPSMKEYSRFAADYNLIECLGKGGFGVVYKVRNKVDDRVYAIKRIPLHHQTENRRRKMTREVKLLSPLNHENVVRYYTSWIESLTEDQLDPEEKEYRSRGAARSDSFSQFSDIPSEEDEDEDWLMPNLRSIYEEEESDNIVFANSEESLNQEIDEKDQNSEAKRSKSQQSKRLTFLYIQMQYCEKNTLQQAIEQGLYADEKRLWRLFIEITNGLDYIHSHGLIHRDLKPGNIFLDSRDYVKIGDFGLATVAFKGLSTINESIGLELDHPMNKDSSVHTGQVGTTLYIAPEISVNPNKVSYTNKVDIYSLGIIFFEMSYPLSSGMERVKILSSIRLQEPKFPDDFENPKTKKKKVLILWLLQHDPQQRPSTSELLKSSLVPPPTEEKQKFMSILESKVQNERSQDYQDILNIFFKSSARPELEETFEVDIPKYGQKQLLIYHWVKNQIISIFKSHGAISVPTPFFIPKGSFYHDKENLVSLMSKGGELITAQFDLRYPFARFIARNDLRNLRRYSVDRVQRAHKVLGIHPTEIYECAFDVISSKQDHSESCARVILVAQEILFKIFFLQSSQVILKITHSELLQIILSYCGIEDYLHSKVYNIIKDFNRTNGYQLEYIGERLRFVGVTRNAVECLKGFLLVDGSIEEVSHILQTRIISSSKKKNFGSSLRGIISQLQEVIETIRIMGVQFEIIVHPLMVVDHSLYNGIAFRLFTQQNTNKNSNFNIFAQGGSYDKLITQHRNKIISTTKRQEGHILAVGISLPLERVVASIDSNNFYTSIETRNKFNGQNICDIPLLDVFICSVEQRQLKERVELSAKLKAENILVDHGFAPNINEAEMLYEENWLIPYFVFLDPTDKAICRTNDDRLCNVAARANDKKIARQDLLEYLFKTIKSSKTTETSTTFASGIRRENSKTGASGKYEDDGVNIRITHIENTAKKQAKLKDVEKKIKDDVKACLEFRWSISSTVDVDVFAVDFDRKVLLALGQLEVDSNAKNFNDSANELKSRFPELKSYIERVCAMLSKKIFYTKKIDKPDILICYSVVSETLKRLL